MLFVMIAGVELDLKKAWQYRRESGITAGLALGTPLLFGCLAAVLMLTVDGWMGAKALTWQFVLGVRWAKPVDWRQSGTGVNRLTERSGAWRERDEIGRAYRNLPVPLTGLQVRPLLERFRWPVGGHVRG